MKSFSSMLAASCLLAQSAMSLKVGLLSDLHLHLRYDPMFGPRLQTEGDCMPNSGTPSKDKATMGRYGCDSPVVLIDQMLHRMVEKFGKQDVILLTGDLVAHHVAMPGSEADAERTYALLIESMGYVNELIASKFPDTLVLPAFGNNDSKFHDNPIPDSDAPFFYNYMFNLWFKLLPGNSKLLTDEQIASIHKTFEIGGYYRVDLNEKVSILSINTLYYDSERTRLDSTQSGVQQMFWLEQQLKESDKDRKFVII